MNKLKNVIPDLIRDPVNKKDALFILLDPCRFGLSSRSMTYAGMT